MHDLRYVFSYLKSGLTPLSQEDMDVLENYVLAYGIKGYKWKKELWSAGFSADEQAEQNYLNDLRRQVMEPFSPWLSRKRTKSYPLREMVQDLLTQLDTLGVAERLNQQAELLRLSGWRQSPVWVLPEAPRDDGSAPPQWYFHWAVSASRSNGSRHRPLSVLLAS